MGGKSGTTTSSVAIPKEVLARYNAVNAQAQSVAATPFQKYSTNPNDFVAGINQQQYAGIGGINQAANMAQPAYAAAEQGTYNAAQGLTGQGYQQGVQAYMNPYLNNAMSATAAQMNNVNRQQQQQLAGNAISAGAFGGDRAGIAQGNLMNQQNLAMGQTLGNMASQGYQQAAQNYLQGQGMQSQMYNQLGALGGAAQQSALQGAQAQLGAGTLEQQTQQAGQTALYNQFLQQQAYPFQVAQFLANIAEGTGALSGSTTTTTQPMPFFSDRRLKKNIERIGQTDEGLPIHKFEYKGDHSGQKHIGFMADEVEQVHPEAVGLHPSGYKVVDYDKASSEGGAVMPYHSGLGFARGGYADGGMPAGLSNMIAQQNAMPTSGGGINTGLAAAAQAIAPQPNVPQTVFNEPSYNVFADPKYQPDLSGANSKGGKGGDQGNTDHHQGKDQWNQNPNDQTDTNTQQPTYDNPFHHQDQQPHAHGGRAGYADGGLSVNDPYDPYSIRSIMARQMEMYNNLASHHVPASRSLASGLGKHGRVPEANLPVGGLMKAGPAPSLPDSMLKQGIAAGSDLADLGTKGKDFYSWLKGQHGADAAAASADSTTTQQDPNAQPQARGGLVGFAQGGDVATPDPADELYSKENTDASKRDIPTKEKRYTLATAQNPSGSPTSQTGLSLGQALALPGQISSFASGIGSLLSFLSTGGVAGHREHHADGSAVGDGQDDPHSRLHPEFRDLARRYIQTANERGYPISLGSSYRSPEEQSAMYNNRANNPYPVAPPGASGHNYGLAMDLRGYKPEYQKGLGQLAHEMGLTYGGEFSHPDPVHVQLGPNRYADLADLPKDKAGFPILPKGWATGEADLPAARAHTAQGVVEKKGGLSSMLPDAMTDSKYVVPFLTGLGAMASSNSPYLGSAILQGLGAGAQSYMDTQRKKAAIAQTEAETNAINAEITRSSFVPTNAGNLQWVIMPDGRQELLSMSKIQDLKDAGVNIRPGFGPSAGGGGGTSDAVIPFTPPSGSNAPQAGTSGEAGAPPAGAAPAANILYDDQSKETARKERNNLDSVIGGPTVMQNYKTSNEYITGVNREALAARQNARNVQELASNLAKAKTLGGFGAPGVGFGARATGIGVINLFARMAGQPELSGAEATSAISDKLAGLQSFMQSHGMNQNSYAALQTATTTVPNPNMPPEAFAPLAAMMMVQQKRAVDAKNHADMWRKDSGGTYLDAGTDFSRKTSQIYADDQNALTALMLRSPQTFQMFMNGRDPQGRPIDEARMRNVLKAGGFDPRVAKYFVLGE
jgi:hypothetical protein